MGVTDWATGIFEGEGCSYLMHVNQRRHTYTSLRVTMTDGDVMQRFFSWAGCGTLHLRNSPSKLSTGRQPIWDWQVTALDDVVRLCLAMFPLLGTRRRDKIIDCLAADTRLG